MTVGARLRRARYMNGKQAEEKGNKALELIDAARSVLEEARLGVEWQDGNAALDKLTDAANAVDEAMGLLNELTEPERTIWDNPHLP